MDVPNIVLSDAERYAVWCEETRALFAAVESGVEVSKKDIHQVNVNDGESGSDDDDDREFPFCFYMRMLGDGKEKKTTHEVDETNCGCVSDMNCSQSSGDFSSVSQQLQWKQLSRDEDALSRRLASKLNVYTRKLQKQQQQQEERKRAEVATLHSKECSFRDGKVEVMAAKLNEELYELLMYVRHQNMLSDQLRRQLVQSKQLLLHQRREES